MQLDPAIRWLFSHRAPNIRWELETMRALLALMGDPQRRLAPILVAGTNGKGSVAAMLHAIFQAAGCRTGLFTSPHLVRPEERIRTGDHDIEPSAFLSLVRSLRALVENGLARRKLPRHPSFFEMTAAIAMQAMADARSDLAVLEVGLGGRLDATNVADPVLSVITTIGLEHTKTLGDTTEKIAAEKAGILRPGVPLVAGVDDAPARAAIEARARLLGVPLHHVPSTCDLGEGGDGTFHLMTPVREYRGLRVGLLGRHQRANAAVAVRAAEVLAAFRGFPLSEEPIREGLAGVRWPGRLEWIDGAPATLLDGAHNPDGCRAVSAYLAERRTQAGAPGGPWVLVFASMGDKHTEAMLAELAPCFDRLIVTRAAIERSADPQELLALARRTDPGALAAPSSREALEVARHQAGHDGLIVVAGSLFLVGEVRTRLRALEGPGNPSYAEIPRATPPAG